MDVPIRMRLPSALAWWFKATVVAVCLLLASASRASEWPLATMQVSDVFASKTQYFYVGKGEVWDGANYAAQYRASSDLFLIVSLDGKVVFSQHMTGQGRIQFALPVLQAGFHRLDFSFTQRGDWGSPADDRLEFCEAGIESTATLRNSRLSYQVQHPKGYHIRHLPDALFNPHVLGEQPYIAHVQLDRRDADELTAMARLGSAWKAAAGVRWHDATQLPAEAQDAHFGLVLEHAPQLDSRAQLRLERQVLATVAAPETAAHRQMPLLRIRYRDAAGLNDAVHALLNVDYLAQLGTAQADIVENIDPPRWAGLRRIQTLADLGIQDLRLEGGSHDMQLIFPSVWQPSDILQGQLALNVQNGLLQGSKLAVWIDNALAGSMAFDAVQAGGDVRNLAFQTTRPAASASFDVRIETTLIANGDCLPRSRGALWIDAAKSQVTLPHRLKSGIAAISAALVPHPVILVDESPGSLGLAISLLQVASSMLLDDKPVPARITTDASVPHSVSVTIDPELYRQRIATHPDKVYAPYAENGILLLHSEDRFHVIAETPDSVANFMRHWAGVQPHLRDGAQEVLLAQDGEAIVLRHYVASTKVTPAMRPPTVAMLGALVLGLLLAIAAWWLWHSSRHKRVKE